MIPSSVYHLGDVSLLDREPVAFFCATRCGGEAVLAAYAWARCQCGLGATVISGFHTPVEKDVFAILARRGAFLIHCPARSLPRRLTEAQRRLLDQGRLLVLTPFAAGTDRATRETASRRNKFVIQHAARVIVAHVHSGSSLAADLGETPWIQPPRPDKDPV